MNAGELKKWLENIDDNVKIVGLDAEGVYTEVEKADVALTTITQVYSNETGEFFYLDKDGLEDMEEEIITDDNPVGTISIIREDISAVTIGNVFVLEEDEDGDNEDDGLYDDDDDDDESTSIDDDDISEIDGTDEKM